MSVAANKSAQIARIQYGIVVIAVKSCEGAAKLAPENGLDGTAAILENMVMNDDKAGTRNSYRGLKRHTCTFDLNPLIRIRVS